MGEMLFLGLGDAVPLLLSGLPGTNDLGCGRVAPTQYIYLYVWSTRLLGSLWAV